MRKLKFDYFELISLNYYKIVFKPLMCDNFFINILFNAIRHSLFINTFGFSVTEIKLFNNNSEFGYLPGLKEDVLNLILNIKGLIFKLKKKRVFLRLSCNSNVVKGKHITLDKYTKLLNPEHVIAHLNDNSNLDLIIKVEKGKGYMPFSSDEKFKYCSDLNDGILIDSCFCPILKASYSISKIHDVLYDNIYRVIFFIETNGSIDARKALVGSIEYILSSFSNFNSLIKKNTISGDCYSNFKNSNLFLSIIDSSISFRTCKYLHNFGYKKIGDLVSCTRDEFFDIPFFTKKTLLEIINVLKFYNLSILD